MRLKSGFIRLLVCGLCFIPAITQASDLDRFKGLSGTINIAGGTAHIPVMKQAAKAIMKANSEIRITIAGGGSGVGAQQVAKGWLKLETPADRLSRVKQNTGWSRSPSLSTA